MNTEAIERKKKIIKLLMEEIKQMSDDIDSTKIRTDKVDSFVEHVQSCIFDGAVEQINDIATDEELVIPLLHTMRLYQTIERVHFLILKLSTIQKEGILPELADKIKDKDQDVLYDLLGELSGNITMPQADVQIDGEQNEKDEDRKSAEAI